jgi:hypothetical protein
MKHFEKQNAHSMLLGFGMADSTLKNKKSCSKEILVTIKSV